MAVYFVHRCSFGSPTEKFVCRFEFDTILDWAKSAWKLFDTCEEVDKYAKDLFGGMNVTSFRSMFRAENDHPMPHHPRTMADVKRWFSEMYCEETAHGPHHIQCLTEWDENQRAVYVFDDHFRTKKPGKADFLLLDGWELPPGESDAPPPKLPKTARSEPVGGAEGVLYFAATFVNCKYNLEDLDPAHHIPGLRLPDLARYLLLLPEQDIPDFPLNKLRSGLWEVLDSPGGEDVGFLRAIRAHPDDRTAWGAYSDWLVDRDLQPAGLHLLDRALRAASCAETGKNRKRKLDLIKTTPSMAQARKHEGCWSNNPREELTEDDTFTQYYFFDDRWASAHPALASGILTFASRWDVLT